MTATTGNSAFWAGLRDGLPFILVAVPFAMLFGVVATEAGLPIWQVMAMTTMVIAGAAQFTALQLMLDDATLWLIVGGALAVNLRMAMYSASLVPHLGKARLWERALCAYLLFDQNYAMAINKYEREPDLTLAARVSYFLGSGLAIAPPWVMGTALGAYVGEAIPPSLALDFALPITFLALVAPMLKTLAHLAAAVVSVLVALALMGLPAGLGLLIAAGCAMVAGATVETLMERRT